MAKDVLIEIAEQLQAVNLGNSRGHSLTSGISDIQKDENIIEITFCTYPDCFDFMKLKIDVGTLKELHEFYIKHYGK